MSARVSNSSGGGGGSGYVGHLNTLLYSILLCKRDKTFHLVWFDAKHDRKSSTHKHNKLTYNESDYVFFSSSI